jgi:hypothetical protein
MRKRAIESKRPRISDVIMDNGRKRALRYLEWVVEN